MPAGSAVFCQKGGGEMTRPPFQEQPGEWLKAPRTGQSRVDRACSVERPTGRHPSDLVIALLLVAVIAGIVFGVI